MAGTVPGSPGAVEPYTGDRYAIGSGAGEPFTWPL